MNQIDKKVRENIVQVLNLSGLNKEKQDKIVDSFFDLIMLKINIELANLLPEQDVKDLEKIAKSHDADKDEKIHEYLESKISGLQDVIKDIVANTTSDILNKIRK